MSFSVIIPARRGSSRLPDKPLLDVAGKPLVVRTAEQAAQSNANRIIVASDDTQICQAVEKAGFTSLLTRNNHPTGTDRLSEVVEYLKLDAHEVVVNVQGDEPLIDPELINGVASLLHQDPSASIATCASRITHASALFNPNIVKVVCNAQHHALYFSRAPIPWARDALANNGQALAPSLPALHHIGLYAYKARFLSRFPCLPTGPLETFESLEQLRALENGYAIAVQVTHEHPAAGVDTQADLDRVRTIFANRL